MPESGGTAAGVVRDRRVPSRMELAGWGLAGFVPLALIHHMTAGDSALMIFGWLSVLAGISMAMFRVVGIWQGGAGLFGVLCIVSVLLSGLTLNLSADPRKMPLMVDFLPVFFVAYRRPSPQGVETVFWLSCTWALASSIVGRLFFWWVPAHRNIWAVARTVLVFGFFLGLHLLVAPSRSTWWFGDVESS